MSRGEYLGEFELVVLLSLARLAEPSYGMAVYDEVVETAGRDVSVQSVYVTLKRLEKKKLISSTLVGSDDGRDRKHYRLLAAASAALRRSRIMFDRLWLGVKLEGRGS